MHWVQNLRIRIIVVTIITIAKRGINAVISGLANVLRFMLKILTAVAQIMMLANFMKLLMRSMTE